MIYWGTSTSNLPSIPIGNDSATAVYYGYWQVWPTSEAHPIYNQFIYYTSDSQIITYQNAPFDATVLNNTYSDYGKIICNPAITVVNDGAFETDNRIIKAFLPDRVKTIGTCAFGTNLQYIYIPNSVNYIGYEAFYNCSLLNNVKIPGNAYIDQEAFRNCTSLSNITFTFQDISIGSREPTPGIGWYAFSGCTSLDNVNIQGKCTWIGRYAFSGCTSLSNIQLPESTDPIYKLESIDECVFSNCPSLYHIEIPSTVTEITFNTFGDGSDQTHNISVCFFFFTFIPNIRKPFNNVSYEISENYKTHYYVPDSLYSSWCQDTAADHNNQNTAKYGDWSSIASYIHPLSDYQS